MPDAIQSNPFYQMVVSHCMRVHKQVKPLSAIETVALLEQAYQGGFANGKIEGYQEIARSCHQAALAFKQHIQNPGGKSNGKLET